MVMVLFFVRVNQVLVRLWARVYASWVQTWVVFRGLTVCLTGSVVRKSGLQRLDRECSEALERFCRFVHVRTWMGGRKPVVC